MTTDINPEQSLETDVSPEQLLKRAQGLVTTCAILLHQSKAGTQRSEIELLAQAVYILASDIAGSSERFADSTSALVRKEEAACLVH